MFNLFDGVIKLVKTAVKWAWEFIKPAFKKAWDTVKITAGVDTIIDIDKDGNKRTRSVKFEDIPREINKAIDRGERVYTCDAQGRVWNMKTMKEVTGEATEPRRKRDLRRECDDYWDEPDRDEPRYRSYYGLEDEVQPEIIDVPEEVQTFPESECDKKALNEFFDGFMGYANRYTIETGMVGTDENFLKNMNVTEYYNDKDEKVKTYNFNDDINIIMTGTRDRNGNWNYRENSVFGYFTN